MKTLKIKKSRKKVCHDISPTMFYYKYVDVRDYIVQMTEEEYFEYIRWKGEKEKNKNGRKRRDVC